MVQEEITYEQSLEIMSEEGLRTECVRLKNKLDMINVMKLSQVKPIKSSDLTVEDTIDIMRQQVKMLEGGGMSLTSHLDILTNVLKRLVVVVSQINANMEHDLSGSCGHR